MPKLLILALIGCTPDAPKDDTGAHDTSLAPLSFAHDEARVLAWATLWQPEEIETLDISVFMSADETTCPSYEEDGVLETGCTDEFDNEWKGSLVIESGDDGTDTSGSPYSESTSTRQAWGWNSPDGNGYEATGSSDSRLTWSAAGAGFSGMWFATDGIDIRTTGQDFQGFDWTGQAVHLAYDLSFDVSGNYTDYRAIDSSGSAEIDPGGTLSWTWSATYDPDLCFKWPVSGVATITGAEDMTLVFDVRSDGDTIVGCDGCASYELSDGSTGQVCL